LTIRELVDVIVPRSSRCTLAAPCVIKGRRAGSIAPRTTTSPTAYHGYRHAGRGDHQRHPGARRCVRPAAAAQQSPGARHPTTEQLRAIAEQPGTTLLIARDDRGAIVGTLTLIIMLTPGATFGFVEDVVVDAAARRQGIGEALVRECLRLAVEQGASRVELHSGNHRPDAIRLYRRVGFKKFETNVWRFVYGAPTSG